MVIGFVANYDSHLFNGYSQVFSRVPDASPIGRLLLERLPINSIADIVGWRFRIPNTPGHFTRVMGSDQNDIYIDSTLFTIENYVESGLGNVVLNFSPKLWDPPTFQIILEVVSLEFFPPSNTEP